MYRLIYMSTSTHKFSTKELESLLAKSEANNLKLNITGLLISNGKSFLQCLEGNKENVTKLYKKIKNDPRHFSVIELIEDNCSERLFPNWSMGYKNIEDTTNIKSNKIKELTTQDIRSLEKTDIYEVFKYFVKET